MIPTVWFVEPSACVIGIRIGGDVGVLGDSLAVEDPILLYSQAVFFLLQVSQGSLSLLLVHYGKKDEGPLTNTKTRKVHTLAFKRRHLSQAIVVLGLLGSITLFEWVMTFMFVNLLDRETRWPPFICL